MGSIWITGEITWRLFGIGYNTVICNLKPKVNCENRELIVLSTYQLIGRK